MKRFSDPKPHGMCTHHFGNGFHNGGLCYCYGQNGSSTYRGAKYCDLTTEDERSTSVFSLYGQLSQGQMANFPAFIASKSFDLMKQSYTSNEKT